MVSTSEVGHAKNVANFYDLISFVTAYGATYNPTKSALKLSGLNTLYTKAQADLATVNEKQTLFNNATNNRFSAFNGLDSYATRLINALDATDATPKMIDDAKGYLRKLRGKKSTSGTPIPTNIPAPNTISASQQSYDQQIQHLAGIISILNSEPSYNPNEADLTTTEATNKMNGLIAKNNEVANAYSAVSNSRIDRNTTLYVTETGLVDIAKDVKKYIKSIFGPASPQYAQVKGIAFKKGRI